MLKVLFDLPIGIEGLKAVGKVSKVDYERVFEPCMSAARREGRPVRFLYELGQEFEGFTAGGAWEDVKLGLRSNGNFEGFAIVSDHTWIRESSRLFGYFLDFPVRVFSNDQRLAATDWLRSLPAGSSVSHRMFREDGVVVVEVKQMLHSFDFDAVVKTVNTWLQAKHKLNGLVIHAHDYDGWENLSSFFRHLRFNNERQKMLERVALAGDAGVTSLALQLKPHFPSAEIGTFGYEELDRAVAWAHGPEKTQRSPKSTVELS